MTQEFGKYRLRFAWFPQVLDSKQKIWFDYFYESRFPLPTDIPYITISKISRIDYIVESLKGTIVDGRRTDLRF